ncbi:MAG TPA: hypothetical protein DD635_05295 [Flavobacteriales bacterium]|nr:hypothetical protein [Flavobacteriales bacterium]
MTLRKIIIEYVSCILCSSMTVLLNAQETSWSVETSLGYALPHRSEMLAIVTGHSRGINLRYGTWDANGWRKNWSDHGPVWQGIQVGWLNGGSSELGKMASGIWLVALPILPNWHVELGSGLAWSTAPYDPVERPLSIAIGTRLNAAIHLGSTAQLFQFDKGWVALGAGITHFSNGSLALPNLGLNNVHVRIRGGWKTKKRITSHIPLLADNQNDDWRIAFATRAGARDINLPGGVLHPTVSAGLYAQKRANVTHAWVLALDLAHNQSLRQFSTNSLTTLQRLQFSSLAGINLHFGRGHLMLLQGWIWTQPDKSLGRRHLQALFSYDFNQKWAIEMGLRSFRLRADYPFLGIRFQPDKAH